jgi:hypothetical protein
VVMIVIDSTGSPSPVHDSHSQENANGRARVRAPGVSSPR